MNTRIGFPLAGKLSRGSSLPQTLYLGFERCDALVAIGESGRNVGGLETLRDVLRAIRVPGRDGEENDLLRACLVAFRHQPCHQRGVALDGTCLAPELDAPPMCVVDQEEISLGILRQIAE